MEVGLYGLVGVPIYRPRNPEMVKAGGYKLDDQSRYFGPPSVEYP